MKRLSNCEVKTLILCHGLEWAQQEFGLGLDLEVNTFKEKHPELKEAVKSLLLSDFIYLKETLYNNEVISLLELTLPGRMFIDKFSKLTLPEQVNACKTGYDLEN